jgi:hypothetical protein
MDPSIAKDFAMNLDGSFTYIGSSMDDLAAAIAENTSATLKEAET